MTIEAKYKSVMKELEAMLSYPWQDPAFYAAWLTQSYYYTSKSTRLLLMAAARCEMNQPQLHRRFATHAGEEKGHDLLAIRDVKDLGYSVEQIGEFPITTAFYATQFHKIQSEPVDSFMGWILPLEGVAIEFGAKIRAKVKEGKSQLPSRFLDVHVDEDPDHMVSAFKVVEGLPKEKHAGLLQNMELTKDLYLSMLDECQKRSSKLLLPLKAA